MHVEFVNVKGREEPLTARLSQIDSRQAVFCARRVRVKLTAFNQKCTSASSQRATHRHKVTIYNLDSSSTT